MRRVVRQIVYLLPPAIQVRLGAAKRRVMGQRYWPDELDRVRESEREWIEATAAANSGLPDRKRIAFFAVNHFSPVDHGLAAALRLRGHDVRGVMCDGLLPLCEMSLGPRDRPPCATCALTLGRNERAFDLKYSRLRDFLGQSDREAAETIVATTPAERLTSLTIEGVPIGRFARRELQRYYRGFVFEPENDPAFRQWAVTAILLVWLVQRWLDRERPDIVGLCSGRTLATACALEVARRRGVRVVSWDGAATFPDTLMFSHDAPATEVPLDDAWEAVAEVPLTPEQDRRLTTHLESWEKSRNTPFPYNPDPIEDVRLIREELGLRAGAPLVVAFANACWDIAVIDRDVGFESMFDWVFSVVEYARDHPAMDFVIRAHPAETNVPSDLRTGTPVAGEIRRRFAPLPANVRLIEGHSRISSYSLSDIATVNMVYASRLGLEIAIRGKRPWVAGAVTYRGKGFTLDIASKQQMRDLLDSAVEAEHLSHGERESARRFAWLWFFRYEVPLGLLRVPDQRFVLSSFRELGPDGDPILARVCEAFVSGSAFLDMSDRLMTA
jgi:hypothetical protein